MSKTKPTASTKCDHRGFLVPLHTIAASHIILYDKIYTTAKSVDPENMTLDMDTTFDRCSRMITASVVCCNCGEVIHLISPEKDSASELYPPVELSNLKEKK